MQRNLTNAEIDALLTSERFGHLGCCDKGKPYVIPLAYVFHANVLYGQTMEGKKTDILRKNPVVCFQVQQQGEHEWRSAICWGTFEELEVAELEMPEAKHVYSLLTHYLGGIQDTVGIDKPSFSFSDTMEVFVTTKKKPTLFRIVITEKTGRLFVGSNRL